MSGRYGPGSEEQSDRLIGVRSVCHSACTICAKKVVVFQFIGDNIVFQFIGDNTKFLTMGNLS